MAIIYQIKERRVIPNWRDYKRTLQLGELSHSNKNVKPINLDINRSIIDWKQIKNIGTAADLINSSFVSGIVNIEVREAVSFVKSLQHEASKTLLELIDILESNSLNKSTITDNSLLEIDVDTVFEFQSFINNSIFHKVINLTKKRAKSELNNSIIWVELARLYSMRGQDHKAEKAILTALQLAPNNRFVLRSATRYFVHTEKFEKAIYYLRKSESLRQDPWLVSAHIAVSSIMGRYSPFIKDGKRLIESKNFSNFELTELSSSLGTLEFKEGSFRKAKVLFEQSMLQPNDNSLAQLEWVSRDDKRFQIDPLQFERVVNPFEARAAEFFDRGNWKEAFYNCIKWFLDMPYSKRPVTLGSYIAGSLLKDSNAAILLCQVGLQANPFDPTLLNNLVYFSAISEKSILLDKYVKQMMTIDVNTLDSQSKVTFQATMGLVGLRTGDIEIGMKLYKLAIKNASTIQNEHLKNLAIANFTNELMRLNLPEQFEYINIIKSMKVQADQRDLQVIKDDILKKIQDRYDNS